MSNLVKVKTDEANRFGKSIQTSAGVITFDNEGLSEVDKNTLTMLIEDGYTDPYPVEDFKPIDKTKVEVESDEDVEIELTEESIKTMTKAKLIEIADSQGFDENEYKKLNAEKLKEYITKKFFTNQE